MLCPGCGLARLPFDLVRLGYAAQGNEQLGRGPFVLPTAFSWSQVKLHRL